MGTLSLLSVLIREQFPQWVVATHAYRGDDTAILKREGLREVCQFLRDDPRSVCNFLMDLTCVDYRSFGKRLESAPTMRTPSPLPYFMKPAPATETWPRQQSGPCFSRRCRLHEVRQGRGGLHRWRAAAAFAESQIIHAGEIHQEVAD